MPIRCVGDSNLNSAVELRSLSLYSFTVRQPASLLVLEGYNSIWTHKSGELGMRIIIITVMSLFSMTVDAAAGDFRNSGFYI